MATSEAEKIRAVFYKFVGSEDHGDEPTESFDSAMSKEVPKGDDPSQYLLYHQALNGVAYLGHFECPCELSDSDFELMKELWPLMSNRGTKCYLKDYQRVLLAKEAGTLDQLKKDLAPPSSSSSSSSDRIPPAKMVKPETPPRKPLTPKEEPIKPISAPRSKEATPTPIRPSEDPIRNLDVESRTSGRENFTTPLPPLKPEPVHTETRASPQPSRLPERLERMLRERQLEKEGSLPRSEPRAKSWEREPQREAQRPPFQPQQQPPRYDAHEAPPPAHPLHALYPLHPRDDPRPDWDVDTINDRDDRSKASFATSPRGIPVGGPASPASPISHNSLRHQHAESLRSASSPLHKGTASIYNDHSNGQVEISWNKTPSNSPQQLQNRSLSREPTPLAMVNPKDNEQILLTRIIEMREELGRLKRDRANWERTRREQGFNVTAHEEYGGQSRNNGKSSRYTWTTGGYEAGLDASQDIVPQYEYDEHLRRRWPSRDQQLVMELEYLHANVMKERELKSKREGMDIDADDGSMSVASRFEPLQGKTQEQLAGTGWDQYQPPEDKEMVVPVTLVVDLGERTSYRQLRTSGRAQTHRFKEISRREIAQAFKHPDHLVSLKKVTTLDDHTIALDLALMASGMKVQHVHADAIETLDNFGIRRLKEGSRAFYAATGANSPCDIILGRSRVGEPTVNGDDDGLSNEVLMLVEVPYVQFEPARFVTSLSRYINHENLCIELKSVNSVDGYTAVHMKIIGTEMNRKIAKDLVREAKHPQSGLHMAVGKVLDAEVIAEDEVDSDAMSSRSSRKEGGRSSHRREPSVKSSASSTSSDDGRRSRSRSRRHRRRSASVRSNGSSSDSRPRRRRSSMRSHSSPSRHRRRGGSVSSASADGRRRRRSSLRNMAHSPRPMSSVKQPIVPAAVPPEPVEHESSASSRSRSRRRRSSSSKRDRVRSLSRSSRRSSSPNRERLRRSRSETSAVSPDRPPSVKAPPSNAPDSPRGLRERAADLSSSIRSRRSRSQKSESPERSRRRRRSRSRGRSEEPTSPASPEAPVLAGSHRQPASYGYQKDSAPPVSYGYKSAPVKQMMSPGSLKSSSVHVPSSPVMAVSKTQSPSTRGPREVRSPGPRQG